MDHRQDFNCFKCNKWWIIDKILIVLSATSGGVTIISFTDVVGAPVRKASASFTLIFSLITGITKNLLSITRTQKEKAP